MMQSDVATGVGTRSDRKLAYHHYIHVCSIIMNQEGKCLIISTLQSSRGELTGPTVSRVSVNDRACGGGDSPRAVVAGSKGHGDEGRQGVVHATPAAAR